MRVLTATLFVLLFAGVQTFADPLDTNLPEASAPPPAFSALPLPNTPDTSQSMQPQPAANSAAAGVGSGVAGSPGTGQPAGSSDGEETPSALGSAVQVAIRTADLARGAFSARYYDDILAHNTIVAYYGNPNSKFMGILGEASLKESAKTLDEWAARYNLVNGSKGVVPAFEIVYGTVFADADVGYVSDAVVTKYIDYAQKHGMVVILDHQLGKYSVEVAIQKMLPFLKYPCVELAIDPEWKTMTPGKDIGTVSADDINQAQAIMQNYMEKNDIPGKKILLVHQFNYKMISDRPAVRADYPKIDLILNADGFGSPNLKRKAWDYNVQATNIPLKGFKLFFPKPWKSKGYDSPLMSPSQVMNMVPQPVYVSYQ